MADPMPPGELGKIRVPTVPKPDVDLGAEQNRVVGELTRFRNEFEEAGVPQLAGHIEIRGSSAEVRYHPRSLSKDVPSVEPLTWEQELAFSYGEISAAGVGTSMQGLRRFTVHDGQLSVQVYGKNQRGESEWSQAKPTTAEEFNSALQGKIAEYNALKAEQTEHAVSSVKVPSVPKG